MGQEGEEALIEKGKISSLQMGIMMYPVIVATGDLMVPAITAKEADRDMWLSPVWASVTGFLIVYIVSRLNRFYPKETIIEYSESILGKYLGKVVGVLYLFFYLHINGMIIRQYGDFVIEKFLPHTPMIVIVGSMVLVSAFAVRGGIEVLGRTAQFFIPIVIVLWILLIIMILPDLDPKNMFPVMEKGILPSIKGAITPQGWYTHFALISFLLPYVMDREKGMKTGMTSVFYVMFTFVVFNVIAFSLFGSITASLTYPLMDAAQYISIGGFLEHIESVVMGIWVTIVFLKVSVFYYVIVLGTAQWLNLLDYKPIVFPIGLLLVIFSIWSAPNMQELSQFFKRSLPFDHDTFQLIIPLFLLLIGFARRKRQSTVSEQR